LTAVCVSGCVQYSLAGLTINYQSILFMGTSLWCQVFLLADNITACLFFFGLSLNCSLDAVLILPFVIYRVICKTVKEARRLDAMQAIGHSGGSAAGGFSLSSLGLDTQGGVDFSLIQILLYKMQSCAVSLLAGFFVPWSAYLYILVKYPSQGAHMFEKKSSSYSFLYDHVDSSLYNQEILNKHNFWYLLVSNTRSAKKTDKFFDELQVPLLALFGWAFLVNIMIILITRGNNKMSSHKKHLLQLALILIFNYTFGSPKL
jgi:hypothetical protein